MQGIRNLAQVLRSDVPRERPWVIELRADGTERRMLEYGVAADRTAAVARGLLRQGLRRGAAIAIVAANSADCLVAYLGIMRAGLVAVPIGNRLPAVSIDHVLADCSARLAFVDADARPAVRSVPTIELGGGGTDGFEAFLDPGTHEALPMQADEMATILYTSGTAGAPKGVPLTHGAYIWATSRFDDMQASMEGRCTLVAAPLYHMNALFLSKLLMRFGGTNVLMERFSASGYLRAIERYRCSVVSAVPTMLARALEGLDEAGRPDLSCVRIVLTGSAPLSEELLGRIRAAFPQAQIVNSWGTTESGPVCFGPHPGGLERPARSLGYPRADIEVRLLGGRSDDEGVLQIRSPAVMRGYLNRPEETDRRLRQGWYDTRDIMRRDGDGFFYFVDRADDMINCAGEKLYPSELEALIERHPEVSRAVVVPVRDPIKHQLPVAFVVPRGRTTPAAESIRSFTLREGPAHMHPRAVFVISELPLIGAGKVDRRALAARAEAELAAERWGAAHSPTGRNS